tara:strand:+ start:8893 stop:10998 length:2106 start_codon:yes stop_codon:yes gene_type:complete
MGIFDSFYSIFKTRQAKIEEKPTKENHGSSWLNPNGVRNPYRALTALEAYGNHGYLYAAINRATEDLSALDVRLYRGKGKEAEEIFEHPILELLEQPSVAVDGFLFREQITLDLVLSGSCYVLLLGPEIPVSMVRLHPDEVKVITNEMGLVGFEHTSNGQAVIYPPDRILTARNASYATGPKSLYGTGSVEPLARELNADLNAQNLASQASSQGHPDVLISPKDITDIWPEETRRNISDRYNKLARAGGAMVLSGASEIKPLNLSPKDMEFATVRKTAMEVISACIGTPPSVLGLPAANYATSRQQAINYWQVQQKRARRIDVMLTKLARLWDRNLYVKHDFGTVHELQDIRKSQLERIQFHIMNGMNPADAYEYEGLGNAPISPDAKPDEPDFEVIDESAEQTIVRLFEQEDPKKKAEMYRRRYWDDYYQKRYVPAHKKMKIIWARYLRSAKKRYVARAEKLLKEEVGKSVVDGYMIKNGESFVVVDDWSELEAEKEEKKQIEKLVWDTYRKLYTVIGQDELDKVMKTAGLDPVEFRIIIGRVEKGVFADVYNWVKKNVGRVAREVAHTTKKIIRRLVNRGREEGKTKSDIIKEIRKSPVFDKSRLENITRTETTRTINGAIDSAYVQAEEIGVKIKKIWITENDDRVRESHVELDGQMVAVTGEFVTGSGATSFRPGEFGIAEEDCNCRCVIGYVEIRE